MDTLIRHFRHRTWSSGEVVATGVSYMADTADIAAGSRAGLTAAIVRESDFDAYLDLFNPGGVANDAMMRIWGGDTLPRDYGRSSHPEDGLDCRRLASDCTKLWPRLQPVDGDASYRLLRQALASRARHWQPKDYRDVEYRDDRARNGYTVIGSSPVAYLAALRRERTPTQYWGSWMDAGTAAAALARFNSLAEVPTEVWITAQDHENGMLTDPFLPTQRAADPSLDAQWSTMLGFLARVRAGAPTPRIIHYYVLGTRSFRSTPQWPPAGAEPVTLRLAPEHSLVVVASPTPPLLADGADTYDVDFSATTGAATRWTTQLGTPAAYPDRRAEDSKLLTYTSAPFERDMELAGTPRVTLYVATTTSDPAFFAYLEDIDPDGRSTYLTEGLFRAVHRAASAPAELPYAQAEPAKSYRRQDALPMQPGVTAEVSFPVFPVAALVRQGHRLRLSLAGADSSAFRRYSHGGPEQWRVTRTAAQPSSVTVNLRPWTPDP
jgi:hypothetical protein